LLWHECHRSEIEQPRRDKSCHGHSVAREIERAGDTYAQAVRIAGFCETACKAQSFVISLCGMTPTVEAVVTRIRAFVSETGIAPATLAKRSGLSPNALAGMKDDNWSPTVRTLQAIEAQIPDDFSAERAA